MASSPTPQPPMPRIVFVDVEASSLEPGSFPLEVGWCGLDGEEGAVLIRPAPAWVEPPGRLRLFWSKQSQAVHGITLATLMQDGMQHHAAAEMVRAALCGPGLVLASDAPSHDGRWLRRLTDAAELPALPPLTHVNDVYGALFRPFLRQLPPEGDPGRDAAVRRLRALAAGVIGRAEEAEERRASVRHRALADAQAHRRVWEDVRGRVQVLLELGRVV